MNRNSGISLFLMELVIMLCVFVAAAAIDTLMLVRADNTASASADLERAVEHAVSAAECYKATGSGQAIGMRDNGGKWEQYYDESWRESPSPAKYAVEMTVFAGKADIQVTKSGKSVYSLSVKGASFGAG